MRGFLVVYILQYNYKQLYTVYQNANFTVNLFSENKVKWYQVWKSAILRYMMTVNGPVD